MRYFLMFLCLFVYGLSGCDVAMKFDPEKCWTVVRIDQSVKGNQTWFYMWLQGDGERSTFYTPRVGFTVGDKVCTQRATGGDTVVITKREWGDNVLRSSETVVVD
jgi:hypothetical protein